MFAVVLSDSKAFVRIRYMYKGVKPGTVLGLLLFLIYIDPLTQRLKDNKETWGAARFFFFFRLECLWVIFPGGFVGRS